MTPQEFEQMLHDAEVKLARLKALYEQWFQGIEKMEPSVARKDLERAFDLLKKNQPRNTALRFRMQQLWARYGTYGIYWGRISRQIEDGTFKRDLVRVAKKHTKTDKKKADAAWDLDIDVDEIEDEIEGDKTDPGLVVHGKPNGAPKAPAAKGAFGDDDIDAILGTLGSTPPAASAPSAKPARPLSPFAMGARPGAAAPATAKATFGKPKDRPPTTGSVVEPLPTDPFAARPVAPKPVVAAPPTPAAIAPPKPVAVAPPPPKPIAVAPPAPKPAPVAPPPPKPSPNMDDAKMRALYSRYVDARKQNNERAEVRFEALAESVEKMIPKLREKHGNKAIEFDVVLSNGKVGLKPKVGP
jgi:hypothetical protein